MTAINYWHLEEEEDFEEKNGVACYEMKLYVVFLMRDLRLQHCAFIKFSTDC